MCVPMAYGAAVETVVVRGDPAKEIVSRAQETDADLLVAGTHGRRGASHLVLGSDDDDDEEYERKVMTIANQMNCVGCEACSKICPKDCYSHAEMSAE